MDSKNILYAKLIIKLSASEKNTEKFLNEIEKLHEFLNNKKISKYFNPLYPINFQIENMQLILDIMKINDMVQNFILFLLRNNKVRSLKSIYIIAKKIFNNLSGIKEAFIYSAKPLNKEEKLNISQFLCKNFDAKIANNYIVDKKLLKGVKINIDDKLIDISLPSIINFYSNNLLKSV